MKTKSKQPIPDPVEIELKPSTYQPSKAEMEEEYDMPGLTMDQIRETFMRPFKVKEVE